MTSRTVLRSISPRSWLAGGCLALAGVALALGMEPAPAEACGPCGIRLFFPSAQARTALSANGRFVVALDPVADSSGGRTLTVTDLQTGKATRHSKCPKVSRGVVAVLAVANDGGQAMVRHRNPSGKDDIMVWALSGGWSGLVQTVAPVARFQQAVGAFSPDGKTVALGEGKGHLHVVNLVGEARGLSLPVAKPVKALAFSPDGKLLVAGIGREVRAPQDEVIVWETARGKEVFRAATAGEAVALSPDGKYLATTHPEKHVVQIWDVAKKAVVRTLSGHTAVVRGVAFGPDGKRLVSVDRSGLVKVWETATGRPVLTLQEHGNRAERAAFSPDGRQLSVLRSNGSVKGWPLT